MTKEKRICSRCVMDTTAPLIEFDENSVCQYCKLHDRLEQRFPLTKESQEQFMRLVETIKAKGKNKKYDCIVGFSGGVDSSYCLYLGKKWGLRPLAVHLDNGWNSEIAVRNIQKIVKSIGVDLRIVKVDWEEFKDMQIAHLKASIPDTENPTDIAIYSLLYKTAKDEGVKYVIHGHSFRNEGTAPVGWFYMDGKYIESVMKMHGKSKKLKHYFNLKIKDLVYYTIIKRIKEVRPLEFIPYDKGNAAEILKNEIGWENYGGLHYESVYTRFNTVYTLFRKFNIDFRKIQYSAYIRTGKMTREEALNKIKVPPMAEDQINSDLEYVLGRLKLDRKEFNEIMALPPKTFLDYPNYHKTIKKYRYLIKIACKLKLLPAIVYEKYAS